MRASSPSARPVDRIIRLALPFAVLGAVIAAFWGEQLGIDHELQLMAPIRVAPGDWMPLRAFLFSDLGADTGPRLVSGPVRVRLRDDEGRDVLEVDLAPSPAGGAEGNVLLPADLALGRLWLEGLARQDDEPLASVRTEIRVEPTPPPSPRDGRLAGALQQLSHGPVEPVGDGPPPDALALRVVGGACVPEEPCQVLLHVGSPAATIRWIGTGSADVGPSAPEATAGLLTQTIVTHGPEATVELEAARLGQVIARRSIQLPVALATPGLRLEPRIVAGPTPPALAVSVLGDRPGVIVDAYRAGHWRRTWSFTPDGRQVPPFRDLSAGIWTFQVRTDPFSAERAAVRVFAVGDPHAFLDAAPSGPDRLRFAWVAAADEVSVHRLPPIARGLPQDVERLGARQRLLRMIALVAIALGLVVVVATFLRRGLDAATEAQRVMAATGDPVLMSARYRRRTLLSALVIVATVLCAFVGAAALIIARARLLE